MSLFRYLHRQINLLFTKLALSIKIRRRADKYFNITLQEFRKKHKRKPDGDEIFLLVVKASHRTAGVKTISGKKGHIKRQWIRKYLLLNNNIRYKYSLQEAKY